MFFFVFSAFSAFSVVSSFPACAGGLQGPVKVLDKDGKPRETLKDTIAILEATGPQKPPLEKRPVLKVRTQGKRFVPRVSFTTPGSPVAFPNLDSLLHNVFSVTPGNAFDTGHYEPGEAPRHTVRAPGLVKLYCNVHHKMNAFLWVIDTPWAEVLDGKAGLTFEGLPPGPYRLKLWHPEVGERIFPVTIGEGVTQGAWTLQANLPPFEPHKNKFGKDYPPAKDEGSY